MSDELETNIDVAPETTQETPAAPEPVERKSTGTIIREQAAKLKEQETTIDKVEKKPQDKFKQTDQEQKIKRPVGRPPKEVVVNAPKEVTTQPALDPIIPPASLTKEEREHFKNCPREIQEIVARRERERDRGLQAVMQDRARLEREYGTYHKALEPHLNRMQRYGLQPDAFVGRMVAWDDAMQEDPVRTGIQFLKAYGVDPRQLIRQGPNGQLMTAIPMEQDAPEVPGLRPLQEEVQQLKGMLAEQQEANFNRYKAAISAQRQAWQNAKDANGQLIHPYIGEMEETIAAYVKHLRQNEPGKPITWYLDEAYDLALRRHPDIRDALSSRQLNEAKKEEIIKQKQRVEASRRGNITPVSTGGPNKTSYKGLTTRQIIERVARGE